MSYEIKTIGGFDFGEVASAFQKSIRRGLEEDALYWGVELDVSGYGEYAWKRMRIMCSEDVGLAEPMMPATIASLYELWNQQRKKKDEKHGPERLFFVHAILLLVRAKKSRIVDHALITHYNQHDQLRREIPDFALDKHTVRGRRQGRSWDHFWKEGITLENVADLPDEYLDRAKAAAGSGARSLFD